MRQLVPPPVVSGTERFRILPENYTQPLCLRSWFGRTAPLEVDLGCGDGGFLVEAARRNAEHNFLGIERLLGRVRKSCSRIARAGLSNTRIFRVESHYALMWLLPPGSVHVLHVAFPDPWPKRRHHDRRIMRVDVLRAAQRALASDGELRFSTDHKDYFEDFVRDVLPRLPYRRADWAPGEDYPQTDFEKRYRKKDLPVYRLKLVPDG